MGMINLLTFCFWFNRKYSPPGIYNGVYFPYSDAIGVLNYFKQCFSLFSLLDLSILEIQKLKRKADKKAITSNTRGTESVAISTRVMADSTV